MALNVRAADRIAAPLIIETRQDRAGADAVDANAAIGEFERERSGEIAQPTLAHGIGEIARLGDHLVHARRVDDHSALLREGQKMPNCRPCAMGGANQIDRNNPLEFESFHLVCRLLLEKTKQRARISAWTPNPST